MANDTFVNKLLRRFGLKKVQDTGSIKNSSEFVPVDPKTGSRVKFSPRIETLWKHYIQSTSDSNETLKNRFERYDDLEYMLYNDTIISMSADLYADEGSQCDSQSKIIDAASKKKEVAKEIFSLLERWGVDQTYVRETLWNMAFFGDSFDINIITKDGVEELASQSVRTIVDRIEFKASDVATKLRGAKSKAFINRDPRLKGLLDELENADSDSYAAYFRNYLFGFQLEGDLFLPPWAVNHYRLNAKKSEFWPFGRSMFIYSIGPFRQLKTSKNLMALTRALSFPKEVYSVSTSESMSEAEKWDAVNEARTEFHNVGIQSKQQDDFSVGSEVWVPDGLLSHNQIKSDLRMDDIADVELLRDDMIMGTRIPKGYLVVDKASFGTSGQSLLQQHKPFGRAVYSLQSAFLEQLTYLIKLHFLITGQFDKEMTEFELTMNFPVLEESQDKLRMKNDTLRLAKDVLDNIGQAVGLDRDEALPMDVVKDVFSNLSFLDPEDVDKYIKSIEKSRKDKEGEPGGDEMGGGLFSSVQDCPAPLREKIETRLCEEVILDSYFESKKKLGLQEGTMNGRHYFTSLKTLPEHAQVFSMLRTETENKLEEGVFSSKKKTKK